MEQKSQRDRTFTRAGSELILSKPRSKRCSYSKFNSNNLSMFKTVVHGEEPDLTQGVPVYTKHNGSRCSHQWKPQHTLTQCEVTGQGPLLKVKGKIHNESEDDVTEKSGRSGNLSCGIETQGGWAGNLTTPALSPISFLWGSSAQKTQCLNYSWLNEQMAIHAWKR